jgi:hypothetical protein
MADRERISEEDLTRHERMVARLREAQAIEDHVKRLAARRTELVCAWKVWCEELHERYNLLSDGTEGVDENGLIMRQSERSTDGLSARFVPAQESTTSSAITTDAA